MVKRTCLQEKENEHFPSNAIKDMIDLPKLKLFPFGENIDLFAD